MCRRSFFLMISLLIFTLFAHGAVNPFVLVVDAGHGGRDHGAPGAYSKEKDLTLRYALAFGKMVEDNCPDVKVIYTRRTDTYLTLYERADIANRNKADLFISFHINALDGIHTAHGFQSYTLGRGEHTGDKGIRENLDVAKRENSVIFMEKDYRTVYKGFDPNSAESDIMFEFIADKNREQSVELSRLMQQEVCKATGRQNGGSHQNNLAVLRLTSMPATLLELGFISTPDEEDFLNSDAALPLYTKGFYNAFMLYKNRYNDKISVPYRNSGTSRSSASSPSPVAVAEPAVRQPSPAKPAPAAAASAQTARKARNEKPAATASPRQVNVDKPVFKIQILAGSVVLKAGDKQFLGLEKCELFEDGARKIYTYGSSNNYNEIYRLRKQILDKFPDCFIIAFKGGSKMDVNEAIKEFKARR